MHQTSKPRFLIGVIEPFRGQGCIRVLACVSLQDLPSVRSGTPFAGNKLATDEQSEESWQADVREPDRMGC
jgi:hypothetical protein